MISKSISKPVLESILNKCKTKGTWPKASKAAEIIPIFKSGDKRLTTKYRPISLISNIGKVFEKIIHKRLTGFNSNCSIISENQFGFMKNGGS